MIKMRDICKVYGNKSVETRVLNALDLDIAEGEFICIYGPSGCGKTSLLNIIGLMDNYTQGRYSFDGFPIENKEQPYFNKLRNNAFGYIFQDFNLIKDLSVLENIEVPMGYGGVKKKLRSARAKALLDQVGLSDKEKFFPDQLSGGEKQRIAIARAMANHPKVILADEPTGSLDQENGIKIMEILKSLNEEGTTIIMVTHDKLLSHYASRVIHIIDGHIL